MEPKAKKCDENDTFVRHRGRPHAFTAEIQAGWNNAFPTGAADTSKERESLKSLMTIRSTDIGPPTSAAETNRTKFAELVEAHNEKLVSFLAARLGDEQEARDVVQEAYAKLLGLGEKTVVSFHRAYLYRTATNIAIDRLRARKRRSEVTAKLVDAHDNLPSDVPTADEVLTSRETLQKLQTIIGALPPKCRYAFLEYRMNNRTYAEIAEDLSISESMVRKYVLRALRHCKAKLAEED